MTLYLLLLLGFALVAGGWYWLAAQSLAADTAAHDSHEADGGNS